FYQGDVADAELLARIFAEQGIGGGAGAIMHFAGSIVVPESVGQPLAYYHNNTAKSRALLEAAVAAGVPPCISASTAAAYGIPAVPPVIAARPRHALRPNG